MPTNPEPQTQAQADMARVLSEIRAAVAGNQQEWEPESGDGPMVPMSWQAPEWVPEAEVVSPQAAGDAASEKEIADAAEAAAVAEITARMAADATTENAGRASTRAQGIDEAVLRDLVRDLIREELSGSLGERITRNVRKLVRAEINRAITARNLD